MAIERFALFSRNNGLLAQYTIRSLLFLNFLGGFCNEKDSGESNEKSDLLHNIFSCMRGIVCWMAGLSLS